MYVPEELTYRCDAGSFAKEFLAIWRVLCCCQITSWYEIVPFPPVMMPKNARGTHLLYHKAVTIESFDVDFSPGESCFLAVSCSKTMRQSRTSLICCQTLHMVVVSWKATPSRLDESQYTRYTQKRLEPSPACFWKYRQNIRRTTRLSC